MTAFAALVGGGLGGLFGAAAAHVLVTALNQLGAASWLKGPFGPPFFDIALYMGVLLAGAAAGALRRPGPAAAALAAAFGLIALPMSALTHVARWGMDAGGGPTNGWYYTVGGLYLLATWGTMAGLGAWGAARRRLIGAALACAGAFAGYGVLSLILWLAPSYRSVVWSPTGFVPSPVNLLDGLLTGAGLSLGIFVARRNHHEESRRRVGQGAVVR